MSNIDDTTKVKKSFKTYSENNPKGRYNWLTNDFGIYKVWNKEIFY